MLFCQIQALPAAAEPGFSLEASPAIPFPGETVNVRLLPSIDATRYGIRWEWGGAAHNFAVKDSDAVSYEAGDIAATVSAQIWDRLSGSDVDVVSLEVLPKSYDITIRILTPEDTVQLWDENTMSMLDRRGRLSRSRVVLDSIIEPRPAGNHIAKDWNRNIN